jgi:hypothetical protein
MTDPRLRGALRRVAIWPRSRDDGPSAAPPDADAFVTAVGRERLTGFAVAAAESGALELPTRALEELLLRHDHQLALDLQLERVLVDVAARFESDGVTHRVLKGPLLAHTVYPDPALRSFGDVDILVPTDSFDPAVRLLVSLGFRRHFAEPRPGFDARFSKGACLERPDHMEIDLHRTFAPGAFGIMLERVDLFRRRPHRFELGGRVLCGLDVETAFVHACFHAALGDHPPRFVPLRDIVQLHDAGLDARAVVEMFRAARCESVCQRALDLVDSELHVGLDGPIPTWAREHRPTRFDRWALQSYARADRSYAGQVAASLWAISSMRERAAYSAALMFPTREYTREHDGSYLRRFARGLRVITESRPR